MVVSSINGDLVLFHGLEQGALRLGRCPVDFVREHQVARTPGLSGIRNSPILLLKTETPIMSAGNRSLVNWMRLKLRSRTLASDCASMVLPRPGRSSISR